MSYKKDLRKICLKYFLTRILLNNQREFACRIIITSLFHNKHSRAKNNMDLNYLRAIIIKIQSQRDPS